MENVRIEVQINVKDEKSPKRFVSKLADEINALVDQYTECGMEIFDADSGDQLSL